jgi:inner membrane protein
VESALAARVLASRWLLPASLAAIALGFDAVDRVTPYSFVTTALLDEPSHFATTALCVLALRRITALRKPFVMAALIASVAIDLDHLPGYFGIHWTAPAHGRPYTHSVATVIVLMVVWVATSRWRSAIAGALFGLVTHLIRDICEGPPGVLLYWPFSDHVVVADRATFWVLIILSLVIAICPWPTRFSAVRPEQGQVQFQGHPSADLARRSDLPTVE